MAVETFANLPSTTVPAGADAPSGGTSETWTVASSSTFPAAATGVTQFHVSDPAQPSEIILVTNVSGTTWTVTRGAESTTPVAHAAGFTVKQVVTAGFLGGMLTLQATTGSAGYSLVNSSGGTICSWVTPNDGNFHRVFAPANAYTQPGGATGGTVQLQFTDLGGNVVNVQMLAASLSAGETASTFKAALVQPNTTVAVKQTTNLSGGTVTVWAELWGL